MDTSNPFDSFLAKHESVKENQPSSNYGSDDNVFDTYLKNQQQKNDEELQVLLNSVRNNDPEKTGEAQRLANRLGLPKGTTINNSDTLDSLKAKSLELQTRASDLAMVNPILARQLRDPNFAAIAHDNISNLANSESLWETITSAPEDGWQGIRKGVLSRELGKIANRLRRTQVPFISTEKGFDLGYKPTEQDLKDFDRIKEINETIANYDADGVGLIEGSGYFVGQYGSSLPEAAVTGLGTWKAKTLLGTGIGAISPDPFTTAAGATVGNFVGLFTGWNAFANKLTYDTFQIEGGHSWLELRENGYSMEDARIRSNVVGTTNAVIEKVGLNIIGPKYLSALSGLKGTFARSGLANTPLGKSIQKRILRQTAKNALGKNGKKLTWNAATRQFARDYAIVLATEPIQEVLQEISAIAGNNLFADEDVTTFTPEQIGDRIWSTLTETFKGMILFGAIAPGITYSSNWNKANKAKNNTAVLEKLVQASKDDVTKKRNPDEYQGYEQNLGDQAGISDFYFNADVFQQQLDENKITEDQLELFSPELSKQLKNAKKEGFVGKVLKIPTGEYLAKIANTELGNALFPHLKEGENEYSQTEMIQFFKDQPELLAAYKELFNQKTQDLAQFTKESRAVKKQIKAQLIAAGIRKDKATSMAALPQAFADTYSKALGITPLQFLNQFQYNIQGETTDIKTFSKQFFNQDGTIKTETQLFKNWFRESKLINPDGTPQILYHGTTDNFDYFDLDHPNRYDSGFAGTGVYLTPNEGFAKIYTFNKANRVEGEKKIMKLYARLENPKIIDNTKKDEIKNGGKILSDGYRDALIAKGHDGVIVTNAAGQIQEIVIFDVNGVKSVDNNGNWSNEVNNLYQQQPLTFEQQAKQKQGKLVPQAIFQIANLRESFDFAKGKTYVTNRDFKLALQERVIKEAKKAKVDVKEFTAEVEKYLVQTVLADANFALEENANAVGWYNEKVSKAKALLSLIYPELATNPQANFAFTWALANTSNGIKVDKNFELAEQAYRYWTENNEFPTNIGIGDASDAINRNFKLYNRLIKEKGFEEFEEFMKTTHTVKEVEAYTNDEVSGETQKEIVYGAAVMGPKIGNGFFANLYGNYEQLTMDRWLMRTWGRMRGELVIDYTKQAKVKRGQLKELVKALSLQEKKLLSEIIGVKVKLSNLDEVGVAIQKASTKKANRTKMNEIATVLEKPERKQFLFDLLGKPQKRYPHISIGGEIRKGGNALAKYLDGQKEAPSGAPERRNIRKVFSQVLTQLQQVEKDLTMADLQALLWYPERRLYDAAKLDSQETNSGYEDNEAPDYANAAESLARQQGVSDADIQTTLQEVDNELKRQATIGTRGSESGDGGTGGIREVDTFQQQGNIDETTGLPINPDGTVTVYHHTDRKSAEGIKATGQLRSAGEPDVYVTTRAIADTGYGNTAVAIRVNPSRLSLDDEFPNGRRDYRLSVGEPRGSIRVNVGEFAQQQIPGEGPRGRFNPTTLTTLLTKEADFSTFAHETAHYMLTVLENIVTGENAPSTLISDFDTLLDFWGVQDIETWKKFSLEEKRKYHETFAYNYEIYLYENKAPSTGLRAMFQRFSYAIKRIYEDVRTRLNTLYRQETGQDLPILTDEVRSVMDRMLASDEQIIQANDIYDMRAMFETQESSGMNDAQWAEYTAALKEAEEQSLEIMMQDSMRQVRWLNNARSGLLKEYQKDNKKLYKKIEAEETKKIKQEKIYKVAAYLKRGETVNDKGEITKVKTGNKISIQSLRNLYPFDALDLKEEIKQLGTGQYGMLAKKGVDAKLIADMFEFKTALDMVDALLEMKPIEDVITERTEERMLNEFTNLTDPRQQELRVQEAIHNEARARFISAELRFLSKSMQPVRYQLAAAKQVAQDILNKKKLSEIRPSEFTRAEARALKASEAAMKKGNSQGAVEAKRSQLLNNQLAKEAIEIHKRYDTAKSFFNNKLFKKSDSLLAKTRNTDLINAARAIVSSYGVGPVIEDPKQYTAKIEEYDKQLYQELEPIILDLQAGNNEKSLTDLTTEDFDYVYEMVESLWYQSLRDEQVRMLGKLQSVEDAATPLVDRMEEQIERSPRLKQRQANPPGTTKAISFKYQMYKMMLNFKAKLRRMEHWVDGMDGADQVKKGGVGTSVLELKGGKLGKFYNTLWFPMKDALTKYREQQLIFTKQYSDLLQQVDFGNDSIFSGELNYDFGTNSNARGKVELLGAMLHTGNKSNLRKLLLGRGWGELREDGSLNTTRWDAFVTRMIEEGHLTKNDYDFLQSVWDLNEKMKPLLQRAHKETEGYYFKEVEASPIVNRFGSYRGGYVPAKTDPLMVDQPVDQAIETTKLQFKMSLPSAPKGMTKSRNESYAAPLSLHLGYMTKHIDDTLRYAYVQPVLKDTLKILKYKDFEKTLEVIDPTIMKGMIMPWLQAAASQTTFTPSGLDANIDKLLVAQRRRAGVGIMFANISNAIQQYTGIFPANLKVKGKYLNGALVTYTKDRQGIQEMIAGASPFMEDRQNNQMFDIQGRLNELIIDPNKFQKFKDWSTKHAYFLQQTFQNQVDAVVWLGTFNQVHAELGSEFTNEEVMTEAIKQADANVRLTQDSLLPEDRAAFQNSTPIVQAITQFTGYFNTMANLNATQFKKLIQDDIGFKNKSKQGAQMVYSYIYSVFMPAVIAGLIARTFGGNLGDEDEDGYLDDVADAVFGDVLKYKVAFIPIIGQAAIIPINALNDLPYDDTITSSPSFQAIEQGLGGTARLIQTLVQGEEITGRQLRDISSMLTQTFGVPVTPFGRSIGYLRDVQRGEITPDNPVDFIRGLLTGKRGRR